MTHHLAWTAQPSEGGMAWSGTETGHALARFSVTLEGNATTVIPLNPAGAPPVRAFALSADRYEGVLFGAGPAEVVPSVTLSGPLLLTLGTSLLFQIPSPTHLAIRNETAEPVAVQAYLLRDA
ncbi:MAG: hypothetical protein N3D18_02095 [Roseococcus sp.]|nr:hypothetical protein [Roseococcus sp.]